MGRFLEEEHKNKVENNERYEINSEGLFWLQKAVA